MRCDTMKPAKKCESSKKSNPLCDPEIQITETNPVQVADFYIALVIVAGMIAYVVCRML